jgi:cell division control protein 45
MSDQVVHERISPEQYMSEVTKYHPLVKNMYLGGDEDTPAAHTPSDSISPVDDYRFMLYRHWNLYDSMYYSRYIASKLGIWKHSGKQMLDTLLARMGLPLDECRQPYASMSVESKKRLKTALDKYAQEFALDQICFPSFQRQLGFKEQQSATDTVYAVTALLEADGPAQEPVPWEQNFWDAYDALSSRNVELLHKGLALAVEHHQAIVRQGVSMMERKAIVQVGPFRYCIVPETPDLHFFTHPLALSRLALFLVETRVLSEHKPHKPIVLAALRSTTSTYVTVGVSGSSMTGQEPNEFAQNFRKAASRTGARVTRSSFDGSVVEVLQNDLPSFMETVHQGLQN